MAGVKSLLERCNPALLDLYGDTEQSDVEFDKMILYLMDSRRIQKVLWRQLSVLDSMMSLLEGLDSSQQLTQPCPHNPDNKARARWKALKAESRAGVEETEALIGALQARKEQIHSKRNRLVQLVQEVEGKKQKSKQLEEALQNSQNALRVCEGQLSILKAESEAVIGCLEKWQCLSDELHGYVSTTQEVMQSKLQSVNQSELCIEQRPSHYGSTLSNQLEPLRLSVTWNHDDHFKLQVNQGKAGLEEGCLKGRLCELSATLLEVMQRYTSQVDMLAEIQTLHSSFAIDWRPAQRLLVYLKSASVVCSLEVEDGYPKRGHAKLLSVRRDTQSIDTTMLKPPKDNMSLTDWLVFLCNSHLI